MPDQTPIYGLRFQELNDPPNGAKLGRELAFDVEDELSRIDGDVSTNTSAISSLDSRVTTNENDITDLKKGWNFIGQATETTNAFTIDLTAGGQYPAGTFNMMKINIEGTLDSGNDLLAGRVNATNSSNYFRGYTRRRFSDGGLAGSNVALANAFALGWWSAFDGNHTELTFYDTDTASALPMQGVGMRAGADGFPNNMESVHTGGILDSLTLLMDSLLVFAPSGGMSLGTNRWRAWGWRN